MAPMARSVSRVVILSALLNFSVAGCYNITAVRPPGPGDSLTPLVNRVVLDSDEVVRLDPGEYELREQELLIQGPSAEDARVIPRTEISRFEIADFSIGKTILAGVGAYVGLVVVGVATGLLGTQ